MPGYYVVLPTYRRDESLTDTLIAIAGQTVRPEAVYVIDNAGTTSCRNVCLRQREMVPQLRIEYIDPGDNTGPAGATAIGMNRILGEAVDDDWILRCDDDSPPARSDMLETLFRSALALNESDSRVAAVGSGGAILDHGRFRLRKPAIVPGTGAGDVDYLATGLFPFYSVAAVRRIGLFRASLFFGYEELEYGLRLRRAGYRVVSRNLDESSHIPTPAALRLGPANWRRYYTIRNGTLLAREYVGVFAAIRFALLRSIIKPLLNLPIEPRNAFAHLRLGLLAIQHVLTKRLGRTVEPRLVHGRLDERE